MKIVIWVIVVICVSLFLGECYYRYLSKKKADHNTKIVKLSNSIEESTEYKMGDLCIESSDIVSRHKLQMRGSWRLAKDNTMSYLHFKRERDTEYKKML